MSKYSDNMPPDLLSAVKWMYDDIEENRTFLDVGCATGYFGSLIKKNKLNKVYGIEISEDRHEAGKVLDGVYSFDIDSNEWPDEIYQRQYDYIYIGDVIEHLKDPGAALERFARVLKSDGALFISTPNIAHISIRLELMQGSFEYEKMGILDNTHLKYFTRSSLMNLVKEAGYLVESVDYTLNDYPDTAIKRQLDLVGLKPLDKFWKLIEGPEARAFQWKLKLRKQDSNFKAALKVPKPPIKPEIIRNAEVDDLKSRAGVLQRHADEQGRIIQYLEDQLKHEKELSAHARIKLQNTLYEKIRRLLGRSKTS